MSQSFFKYHLTQDEIKKGRIYFNIKLMVFMLLIPLMIGLSFYFYEKNNFLLLLLSPLMGLLWAHASGLQHELAHGALPSRNMNRFFGILLSTPFLIAFSAYRTDHAQHHVFLGTPKNNEIFTERDMKNFNFMTLLSNLFGLNFYKRIPLTLFNNLIKKHNKSIKYGKDLILEYSLILAFIISIIFITILFKLFVLYVYFIPIIFIGFPIKNAIEIAEHFGCNTKTQDVFKNSRVITGPFSNWISNGNSYHVSHHLYPTAPLSCTKMIHPRLEQAIEHRDSSYIHFYSKIIFSFILKGEHHGKNT